ncbi:hypothetical protein JCM10213_006452 [Rhodosporidiobolus nylandii]
MSSPYKQQTLSFSTGGRLVVGSQSPSSRSPSPTFANSTRAPIRHVFGRDKKQRAQDEDVASGGEDVSDEDEDDEPRLGPKIGNDFVLDDEAEETSDEDSGDGEGGPSRRRKHRRSRRRHSDEDEEDEEDRFLDERHRVRGKKNKGKQKASIVLNSDTDDEPVVSSVKPSSSRAKLPVASTSASIFPSASTSAAAAAGARRPARARSVFEGVIIDISPRKAASMALARKESQAAQSAAQRKGPSLFAGGAETTEEGKARPLDSSDEEDVVVRPSQKKKKGKAVATTPPRLTSKGKKRARSPSTSPAGNYSSATDSDALPVPASLRKASRTTAAKRERKAVKGRAKLANLTQGVQDRRSADERSGDEAFVVDDDAELRYDTDVEDEMAEEKMRRKERRSRSRSEGAERKKGKGKRRARDSSGTGSEEEPQVRPRGKKRRKLFSDAEEEGEDDLPAPGSVGRQPPAAAKKADKKGKGRAVDGEDDAAAGAKGARKAAKKDAKKAAKKDAKKAAKEKKRAQAALLASDEEGDSEDKSRRRSKSKSSKTKKGKGKKEKKRRRAASSDDGHDDEPDDLEILDEQTVFEDRFRTIKGPAAKFAALKAAREKRAAAAAKNKLIVLDSEDDSSAAGSRSRSASARPSGPRASQAKHRPSYLGAPSSSSSEEDSDSEVSSGSSSDSTDIEEFIVEEEDEDAREIVDAFRESVRGKAQGLKFYLKTYLLLLVHEIVCPEVDWLKDGTDDFRNAKRRVDEQIKGLVNSLIASSAWRPKFQHALETRPEMNIDELAKEDRGVACEACTMGKSRHSVFVATFFGRKYNRKTLRLTTCESDSSIDSDDSSDDSSDDEKYPKEKTFKYNLGQFCATRARVYHQLHHWAYETKQRMREVIKPVRKERPNITYKSGLSGKEKSEEIARAKAREANAIGGLLEDKGVITQLANRLNGELETAIKSFTK